MSPAVTLWYERIMSAVIGSPVSSKVVLLVHIRYASVGPSFLLRMYCQRLGF